MTPGRTSRFTLALMVLSPATGLLAQESGGPGSVPAWQRTPPAALQRADPGIGDVDPLGLSLRDMQFDLRTPAAFDTVFRLDRTDAFGRRGTMFMRIDGGTTAVFQQSLYAEDAWGQFPVIPPGTTFYIGDLPPDLQPREAPGARPVNMLDLSYPVRAAVELPAARFAASPEPQVTREPTLSPARSVWTDAAYREGRLAALLASAAEPVAGPARR